MIQEKYNYGKTSPAQCTDEVTKLGEITKQIDELNSVVNYLTSTATTLSNRLDSILRPVAIKDPETKNSSPVIVTPLGIKLASLNDRVHEVNCILEDINRNLEL